MSRVINDWAAGRIKPPFKHPAPTQWEATTIWKAISEYAKMQATITMHPDLYADHELDAWTQVVENMGLTDHEARYVDAVVKATHNIINTLHQKMMFVC